MHNLKPITPLGHAAPQEDNVGAFTITEIVDRAMASVTARDGQEKAVAKILAEIIGAPAPAAGEWAGSTAKTKSSAFWTSRGQWMVEAPINTHEDITAKLAPIFKGKASLTEQHDGWCRFEITGGDLDRLASLMCNVDMRNFGKGSATRTTIDHLGCFLTRSSAASLTVLGPRSSAQSLHHAMMVAMKSSVF